ncbi:MAG: hypothetical protein KME38_29045 [Spirirestis rafaelensis WJT71-NPBG6]|jgi:metal-responsive CopG/Arc/MetJ family transcriptional regulator|nr:hypothetical protein [Spirirestis rafaelensis WJT71-NPBG6]
MASKQEKRLNISLRLPDFVVEKTDERAKELQLNRTDIVEKALRCFLGIGFDVDCSSQNELERLNGLVQTLIEANNLKTEIET